MENRVDETKERNTRREVVLHVLKIVTDENNRRGKKKLELIWQAFEELKSGDEVQ